MSHVPCKVDSVVMFQLTVDRFEIPLLSDLHPEAPVCLEEATWLPELGGAFTYKQLWSAVRNGTLPAERHGRTLFVTRAGIAQWRDSCRVNANPPASSQRKTASVRTEPSFSEGLGSSSTADGKPALDAALATVQGLRGRSRRTS